MAFLLKTLVAALAGLALGLLVTILALDPRSRGLSAGPWRGAPREGTLEIDPYTLASIDRSGTLPLGAAEGLRFVATTDGRGAPLLSTCDYEVVGPMPAARFWTLSVLTPAGFPMANPAARYGFTSAEVLRDGLNPVVILVSREAQAGNWLPVARSQPFILALHLYDTGLSAVGTRFEAGTMPAIRKRGCEP